jgi:hypothetical protein
VCLLVRRIMPVKVTGIHVAVIVITMSYYGNDPNKHGVGYYGNASSSTGGGYEYNAAAANVQAWQASSQQQSIQLQQQHAYAPQHHYQPQQQTGLPSVWNPAAAAAAMAAVASGSSAGSLMTNDAVLHSISSAGQSFFQQGTARMIPGLESTMLTLRYYFAVDNRYVMLKIQKVLVPFFSNDWKRQVGLNWGCLLVSATYSGVLCGSLSLASFDSLS